MDDYKDIYKFIQAHYVKNDQTISDLYIYIEAFYKLYDNLLQKGNIQQTTITPELNWLQHTDLINVM